MKHDCWSRGQVKVSCSFKPFLQKTNGHEDQVEFDFLLFIVCYLKQTIDINEHRV